ncbi:MAG: dolichol-phosphate mannosyltransferase, partial [Candidatus Thermofonsia Clade 3 bacterium]
MRRRYNLNGADTGRLSGKTSASVRLFVRTQDKGLAQSIRDGLLLAHGRTLVVMDTDFNHDPAMIPQMVDLLRYYDLVIGSRFVMRGGMEDRLRYHLSQLY